jgi:hypothetical protein
MLEKKWEYNGTVTHLFLDSEKAYESVRREKQYSQRNGRSMQLVGLILTCLSDNYSKVRR